MARPRGILAATSSPQGVEMYGGRSTTDPYASYPPARPGDWSNPYPQGLPSAYPQGLPAQAHPAMDTRLADDVLDLAGYERREADVGPHYDAYQPPPEPTYEPTHEPTYEPAPPTAPTMVRSQDARSQDAQDEHHGRLVMMDLAGAAPGPANAPDPAQVRILGGPPPRSQFSEGWAAPSGYLDIGGGLRSNGRVALIAACIAATIGVVAAVVISTVNAPGAARVEFGTSESTELLASQDAGGGVVTGDPAQAVASAPAATAVPIAQRTVELAPVRRPGSTNAKPRVVGPTKTTPKASATSTKPSPTPSSASPTPTAEPTPTPTTPSPAPTTSTPTAEPPPEPTASQQPPQPSVPSETLPTAEPNALGG